MSNVPSGPYGQGGAGYYVQGQTNDPTRPADAPGNGFTTTGYVQGNASDAALGMYGGGSDARGFGSNGQGGIGRSYTGPQLGSTPGGAETLANMYAQAGADAQSRQAAQINAPSGADPMALAHQQQAMALMQRQANGGAPSAAGIGQSAAINQGLGAAFAAQRGGMVGAGGALGGQNMGAIAQGGAGRMGEYGQAMGGLASGANDMSGLAVGQAGQDQRLALHQANLTQQQQAANNQSQLGFQQLGTNAGLSQLQADTSWQLAQQGSANSIGIQNLKNNAETNGMLLDSGMNAASSLGSLAAQYNQSTYAPQAPQVNQDTGMTDQQENNY
jgi:hypothetical protein